MGEQRNKKSMIRYFSVYCSLFLLVTGTTGRSAPYYDLNEDYYYDIRHILDNQFAGGFEEKIKPPREVRGWGLMIPDRQVSGIAVDLDGNPVIFHRGNRIFDIQTFNSTNHVQYTSPIEEDVVLTLKEETGVVLRSWGAGIFYLPHGITIDAHGNIWVTDVGRHQVLKFEPNSKTPSMTLGKKLEPGSDQNHFCKPTAVAISPNGEIFVADGYCNARILHFNPEGSLRGQYGHYGDQRQSSSINIPHGITLSEKLDALCIADRENLRVVCIRAGLTDYSKFGEQITLIPETHNLPVYDIAFLDKGLVGISGRDDVGTAIGFTADLDHDYILDYWEPIQKFHNPHSITVDEKRGAIYVSEIGPNRIWKFVLDIEAEDNVI